MNQSPRNERGASAVEYGLLIAGIAAVIVIAVFALGGVTDSMFSNTCQELDSAAAASATC
jgi:pilus assembly protein Flp/PilA